MKIWTFFIVGFFLYSECYAFKDIKGEFGYTFGRRPATQKLSLVAKNSAGSDKFARQYEFTPKKGKLPGYFNYRMFLSHRTQKLYKLQAYKIYPDKPRCQAAKLKLAEYLATRYESKVETFKVPSISNIKFQIIPLGENNITVDCIASKLDDSQIFNFRLVVTYHNHASKKIAERERPN